MSSFIPSPRLYYWLNKFIERLFVAFYNVGHAWKFHSLSYLVLKLKCCTALSAINHGFTLELIATLKHVQVHLASGVLFPGGDH